MKSDLINDIKPLPTVYRRIFDVIQSDIVLQKHVH